VRILSIFLGASSNGILSDYLSTHQVFLPNGDILSTRRLRSLGLNFYGSGGFETIHWLFESPWIYSDNGKELSYQFLNQVQSYMTQFETNPLYLILHEAIYVQHRASNWAASKVLSEHYSHYFDQYFQVLKKNSCCQNKVLSGYVFIYGGTCFSLDAGRNLDPSVIERSVRAHSEER
jgi:hypothetical protein